MKYKGLLFLTLLTLTICEAQDIVYRSEFPKMPGSEQFEKNDFGKIRCYGEVLRLQSSNERFHPTATFKNIFPESPYELSFEMRYRPDDKLTLTGGHWGFIVNGEKQRAHVYIYSDSNKGVHVKKQITGERQSQDCFYKGNVSYANANESPFHKVRLKVRDKAITLEIDDEFVCTRDISLIKTKQISFYGFRCSAEVKNLQIRNLAPPAASAPQKEPVIYAAFDNSEALAFHGESVKPQGVQIPQFVEGLKGQAIDLSRLNSDLRYIFNPQTLTAGTISFWFSPRSFDSVRADRERSHVFLNLSGENRQGIGMEVNNHAFGVAVRDRNGKHVGSLGRWSRDLCHKGDWVHYAVTYTQDGDFQLYINALPYFRGFYSRYQPDRAFLNNSALDQINQLLFSKNAGIAMDELKIYNRPLSCEEIVEEYRRYMPIDMTVMHANMTASKDETLSIQVAPAGYYMRPDPAMKEPVPAEVQLKAVLVNKEDGTVIAEKSGRLNVDKPLDFAFAPAKYPAGNYILHCTVNGKYVRSFDITSFNITEPAAVGTDDVKKGKLVFEKRFTSPEDKTILRDSPLTAGTLDGTSYVEAASGKCDRFSVELNFGKNFRTDRPYLLEIDWPDDKPRAMGCYMHIKAARNTARDTLQSGVQAGIEYPSSNKIQTLRHIFFADSDEYLFEARTMIVNRPAAVSAIRVYETADRLPKLAVNLPEGLEGRHFGNFDEDQTIDSSLPKKNVTNSLLDYMDYTGQDIFSYAILRYHLTFFPYEGTFPLTLYPHGRFDHLVSGLEKRGIRFIADANMFTIPDFMPRFWEDYYKKQGMILYNNKGAYSKDWAGLPLPDISSEAVQELLIRHFTDYADMLGQNGNFDGFAIGPLFFWNSPESGYGANTLARFTRDTGIKVPSEPEKAYKFLTEEKPREWMAWRTKVSTNAVRKLAERLWKINPKFKLYVQEPESVVPGGKCWNDKPFQAFGFDWNSLRSIGTNISLMSRRDSSYLGAMLHYGRDITDFEDRTNAKEHGTLARYGQSIDLMKNFINYFETRASSLMPKKYATYFQDSDCKPHGRFYLKDMALSLAYSDALSYIHGGQPLGSWGREEYAREFARAYRALPKIPFRQCDGISDPVTVRYCQTKNGTYFYVVNICPFEVMATLHGVPSEARELATGKMIRVSEITLKPYELRSFLIPSDKKAEVSCVKTESPAAAGYYAEQLKQLEAAIASLKGIGTFQKDEEMVRKIAEHVRKKEYAEAHRLIFSQPARALSRKYQNCGLVKEEAASVQAGRIAINCGEKDEYYKAPDGRLFFPDRPYSEANGFGFLPGTKRCIRATRGLGQTDAPGLFATEAWDCPGYKFNLPNGRYRVKLYMKWGFTGRYKEGITSLTCKINGRSAFEKVDFYKLSADFNKPHCFESETEVKDGVLSIEFINEGKTHSSTRLCNGIEIVPVK